MSISFSTIIQKGRMLPTHSIGKQLNEVITKVPITRVSPLANGFRIASEENPNSQFATVGVWMNVGTKYEDRHTNGTAKLLEVCALNGTTNQSRAQIQRALDEIGGHLMVNTGREQTYYAVKCHKDRVNQAVGLLSDIVRNARITDEDLADAKKQVNHLRKVKEEDVDDVVMENLHTCAYDSTDSGLGLPLLSTEAALNGVTKEHLTNFRNTHVTAPRCVLVGAGAVTHEALENAAKQYFGDMSSENKKTVIQSRYVGGDIRLWNMRMKMFHMAWAFETCGANCADTVPLQLANQLYGPFHRSQQELGQSAMHRVLSRYGSLDQAGAASQHFPESGLETVLPFSKFYEDNGLQGMFIVGRPAQCAPEDASNGFLYLQYTMLEYVRPAQRGCHFRELDQAKVNMKAQVLFNMDGSTNTAEDIGRQVLIHNRRVPLQEQFARIDDVTATNLQETMHHYYFSRRPVMSALGYLYAIPNYDYMQYWTWRFW